MEDLRRNPQNDSDLDALDATIRRTPLDDNRQQARRDEEEALRSLDDTPTRTMPQPTPLWEADEPATAAPPTTTPRHRISTMALVCVVAVVSFVAGGMTVRLTAQMPLLFPQQPEQVEAPTTYVPAATDTDEQEDPSEDIEPSPTPAPIDPLATPEHTEAAPETEPEDHADTSDDTLTYRWDLDSEGDRSLSYDTDSNRVTFDYDGYLFSLDLDELMAEPDSRDPYLYDDSTGYDSYRERDTYGWTRQVWGGSWA